MSEFFHGWQRKIGCVLLVMAILFTCVWMRSRSINDAVRFTASGRRHLVYQGERTIHWYSWDKLTGDIDEPNWMSTEMHPPAEQFVPSWYAGSLSQGFPYSDLLDVTHNDISDQRNVKKWAIPYWLLITPLTVLSAYLILRPVKRKATQPTQNSTTPTSDLHS